MGKGAGKVEETEYQKAIGKRAGAEWNRYQDVFVPVENEYIRQSKNMNSKETYKGVEGDVNLNARSANDAVTAQVEKSMNAAGINPNSGKATGTINNISTTNMGNQDQVAGQGQHSATERYIGNQQNVVAMGQGQKTTATAGLQDIARASGRKATDSAIREANAVSIPAVAAGVGASALAGTSAGREGLSNVGKNIKAGLSESGGVPIGATNQGGYGTRMA
ncbi:hypothetical protein C9I94_10710 [Photobacterium swingsii]|uniref:Uncharacterized protein n=1 Tax=Photobacterium swingsii TaxID=680026 RepID=A0A2T3P789_9GAMM|nr:hypothetical protein [Photobacterium swingsii]PSW24499.1 hypothetical protein C9I94_10710 [Photobacterium swingsii]